MVDDNFRPGSGATVLSQERCPAGRRDMPAPAGLGDATDWNYIAILLLAIGRPAVSDRGGTFYTEPSGRAPSYGASSPFGRKNEPMADSRFDCLFTRWRHVRRKPPHVFVVLFWTTVAEDADVASAIEIPVPPRPSDEVEDLPDLYADYVAASTHQTSWRPPCLS